VQHVEQLSRPFPWRSATLIAVAIALLELVGLIFSGALLLARSTPHHRTATVKTTAVHGTAVPAVPGTRRRHVAPVKRVRVAVHPLRARSQVRVLVLNGNGHQGAAHTEAAHLHGLGYPIGGATNAARHDYARSMVMFVPGWQKEAQRLARDTGIRLVAPVDGITAATLKGSRVVVLLGS
jgi:LytR cell envelope-related transcriptional attenuator